jgi:beta-lactamase regulating signal transducer with metallopeptidase domain
MLETVITSSLLIAVLILLRYIFRGKIDLRLQYALWLLAAIRLLMPFSILDSSVSVLNIMDFNRQTEQSSVPVEQIDANASDEMTVIGDNDSTSGTPIKDVSNVPGSSSNDIAASKRDSPDDIVFAVWLAGAIAIGLWFIIQNILFYAGLRKTREPANIKGSRLPVFLSRNVKSPCLFGLRPKIYIHPDSLTDDEVLKYILVHEETHYRHGDHLWSYLRCICLALHWFNPLVWWAAVLSRRDCEIACDESTIIRIGEEHRKDYGNTLLNMIVLAAKPSDLLLGATAMTLGRSGFRERITMIAKKPKMAIYTLIIVMLIAAVAVGCTFTGAKAVDGDDSLTVSEPVYEAVSKHVDASVPGFDDTSVSGAVDTTDPESDKRNIFGEITRIDVNYESNYAGSEASSLKITDSRIISDIIEMISQNKPFPDDKPEQMRQMTKAGNKLILTDKDGNKREILFAYDDLYTLGYVQIDGKLSDPGYDFFRYLEDYAEYRQHDTSVGSEVSELFTKYGWTADYMVNSTKVTLPPELKHKAGEFPVKLYWAYNNELSKSVGLDFSSYTGERVNAEIYRLREPLPDFLKPRMDARGIIIKYNGRIIGAYIDAGRHSGFACSLDRRSLEEVTGKDWSDWIDGYIDYSDELEMELSSMSPEELISQYFEAMDKQDERTLLACMTRSNLCGYLFANMDNNLLFNSGSEGVFSDGYSNVKSVKLIDISELKDIENPDGVIEYNVTVDFHFRKVITTENGVQPRFVLLEKETGKGGWRISGVGTGP